MSLDWGLGGGRWRSMVGASFWRVSVFFKPDLQMNDSNLRLHPNYLIFKGTGRDRYIIHRYNKMDKIRPPTTNLNPNPNYLAKWPLN